MLLRLGADGDRELTEVDETGVAVGAHGRLRFGPNEYDRVCDEVRGKNRSTAGAEREVYEGSGYKDQRIKRDQLSSSERRSRKEEL